MGSRVVAEHSYTSGCLTRQVSTLFSRSTQETLLAQLLLGVPTLSVQPVPRSLLYNVQSGPYNMGNQIKNGKACTILPSFAVVNSQQLNIHSHCHVSALIFQAVLHSQEDQNSAEPFDLRGSSYKSMLTVWQLRDSVSQLVEEWVSHCLKRCHAGLWGVLEQLGDLRHRTQ